VQSPHYKLQPSIDVSNTLDTRTWPATARSQCRPSASSAPSCPAQARSPRLPVPLSFASHSSSPFPAPASYLTRCPVPRAGGGRLGHLSARRGSRARGTARRRQQPTETRGWCRAGRPLLPGRTLGERSGRHGRRAWCKVHAHGSSQGRINSEVVGAPLSLAVAICLACATRVVDYIYERGLCDTTAHVS
jgi:hypothetical protein